MQDFSLARRAMVDSQLRPEAVTDRGVLAAMASVERENFVPESARALAYFDRPLRLSDSRAMMPPAALGRLLSELAPRAGERALIVGSGTGYAAALLKAIGLEVVALESDEELARTARAAGVETVTGQQFRVETLEVLHGGMSCQQLGDLIERRRAFGVSHLQGDAGRFEELRETAGHAGSE